ncbi:MULTISPECIES: carbonic anhydrase family protein [unclassified Enterococcus]|uniref:carbonic anhydrase family protein n=1 Tax=unclassified Enterococcus TaxID=2608891 RepID=UPI001554D9BB|nr:MULTISPECIES: carbonic anhydrase family protein [unclassified Enterococcus]MBS7578125.1 carbonic anhydrase family protein [Enterococcus sp. MMGLQ5-2]MBS7585385.1 carbonic anhydrase family protein [Enterococcus sp. MMGLQ5-1]NPD13242.1 carbonic anhydrase family protein [Enterococcus sp. MMGLQ5-1]NPD37956.1 carbonic anhydrase family protein [Enterococcus sp. MMGLQ5-2]
MKLRLDYKEQKWSEEECYHQSPINIDSEIAEKRIVRLTFDYQSKIEAMITDEINAYVFGDGLVTLNKKIFYFKQFHIHTTSEHQIDGKGYPGELHLVHWNDYGELMVIAIFLQLGAECSALNALIEQKADYLAIDQFLPNQMSGYKYTGSLTTPPLSSDVTWIVLDTPIQVSQAQLELYQKDYPNNNRKIQPLQDREIARF